MLLPPSFINRKIGVVRRTPYCGQRLAAEWLTENPLVSLETDTDVDIYDLKLFCNAWLEEQ